MRTFLLWIGLAVFVAGIAALASAPLLLPKPTARQLRQQLLDEIWPIVLSNCTLQRYGSANDGGYLMCGNLLGNIQSAYSYGIGPRDDWGCDISEKHNVPVHQYDCFSPPEDPCSNGRSVFHNECVGPKAEIIESRTFDSITSQISKNGDTGKTLVVKVDIEGAELASLMATSDQVLNRIDQLAMEIHGTDRRFLELVRKLKRTFYAVHIHFNNLACSVRYKPFPAWAYQVLLVNKRIAVPDPSRRPTLPHPLDAREYAEGRDCQTPLE